MKHFPVRKVSFWNLKVHFGQYCLYCLLFFLLYVVQSKKKKKSNYLNSHGEEAQEKPQGL